MLFSQTEWKMNRRRNVSATPMGEQRRAKTMVSTRCVGCRDADVRRARTPTYVDDEVDHIVEEDDGNSDAEVVVHLRGSCARRSHPDVGTSE